MSVRHASEARIRVLDCWLGDDQLSRGDVKSSSTSDGENHEQKLLPFEFQLSCLDDQARNDMRRKVGQQRRRVNRCRCRLLPGRFWRAAYLRNRWQSSSGWCRLLGKWLRK